MLILFVHSCECSKIRKKNKYEGEEGITAEKKKEGRSSHYKRPVLTRTLVNWKIASDISRQYGILFFYAEK